MQAGDRGTISAEEWKTQVSGVLGKLVALLEGKASSEAASAAKRQAPGVSEDLPPSSRIRLDAASAAGAWAA
eukprot:5845205-Alexandrium_andersonii.AAC.1